MSTDGDRVTFTITFPFAMVVTAVADGRLRVLGEDGQPVPGTPEEVARVLRGDAEADARGPRGEIDRLEQLVGGRR